MVTYKQLQGLPEMILDLRTYVASSDLGIAPDIASSHLDIASSRLFEGM